MQINFGKKHQTIRDTIALIEFCQTKASSNLKHEIHKSFVAESDNLALDLAELGSSEVLLQAVTTLEAIRNWLNSSRQTIDPQEALDWQSSATTLKIWAEGQI